MGRHDRIAATIIVSMLAVLWLGFLVHRAPFFAGSLWGGVFGVVGAAFLLVPLVYTVVKRSATLRRAFTREHSFAALLQAHVYFGLIGALVESGASNAEIGNTAQLLRVLSGLYDQAARAGASL